MIQIKPEVRPIETVTRVTSGFRRVFRVGPLTLDRVGSWGHPSYPMFGRWQHDTGWTLRFRAWLLIWSRR